MQQELLQTFQLQQSHQSDLDATALDIKLSEQCARKALPFKRELTTQSIINCLKSQRKFTEAIAECSTLIKENPKDEQAFGMRAALKSSNHDDKGALSDYTKAISLMPTSRYYKERAKVYEKLGQADLARQDLVLAEKEY